MRKDQRGFNAVGELKFRMWRRWWKSENVDILASPLCSGGCWVILSFTHALVRVRRSGGTVSTSDNHKPDTEKYIFREGKNRACGSAFTNPPFLITFWISWNNLCLKSDNLISQCAFSDTLDAKYKVLCPRADNYSLDLLFNQQKHHSLLQLVVLRSKIFILNKSDKAALVRPWDWLRN